MKKQYIFFTALTSLLLGIFVSVTIWIFAMTAGAQQKGVSSFCRSRVQTQESAKEMESGEISAIENSEMEDSKNSKESENLYPVVHVFDGDTFSIDIDGEIKRVRLIGINTPETSEKYRSVECFGKEATERAVELLGGKQVRLEEDSTQANIDAHGRILRYVFLEDGRLLNQLMIEEGFGKEYTFKGSEYKYQKEFRQAENKAKEESKGLWDKCSVAKK